MIDNLKPYSEYKDSSLPWLGSIPAHWLCERAKGLFVKVERPVRPEDEVVTCFRNGTVTLRKNRRLRGYTEAIYELGYQGIRKGDLVIHAMDAFAGAIGVSDSDGKGSPIYGVCRPKAEADPNFYALVVREMARAQWILALSRGIRERSTDFRFDSFARQFVPVPPVGEQAAIVRLLHHANGKIERAIQVKWKLIALLNEQKQAVIHSAVTRGLDHSTPTSTRSDPFLALLPSHWSILRAKLLFRQVVPPIPDGAEQVTCFRDGQVTLRRNRRTTGFTNAVWELGYQGIEPGQLVLHSMDAFAGAIGVSDSRGKCSPEYVICEAAVEGLLLDYYAAILRSLALRGLFVALCPSVRERAPRVRFSDFSAFSLPKPPLREQEEIVRYIRIACRELDLSLSRVKREIELLREYRTRLAADVVTGKFDVREAVKSLPVEREPDTLTDNYSGEGLDEEEAGEE